MAAASLLSVLSSLTAGQLHASHSPAYSIFKSQQRNTSALKHNVPSRDNLSSRAASVSRTEEVLGGAQRLSNLALEDLIDAKTRLRASELDASLPQNAGLPLSGCVPSFMHSYVAGLLTLLLCGVRIYRYAQQV